MRRFLSVPAFFVAFLLSAPAWAVDNYLGTVTSTGASVTNLTTAAPFTLRAGWVISVQCDADAYVVATGGASPTVTSSNALRILQWVIFPISLADAKNPAAASFYLGVISATGTANCVVSRFDG